MLERAKVEEPDFTPKDYEDPEVGRDPENNQTGGMDIDTGNAAETSGCSSGVSASSLVMAMPVLLALAIAIIAKKRRKE